ncbi:endonuclease MutS2 [Mycoplasmatota bacterium]|nr:endonuclease MutS2 [Mycoplasmatota bacterium]
MNTSYKTLEIDKILKKLGPYTSCSLGQEAIEEIEISNDIDLIQSLLNETDEALHLLYRMGEIPLGGISDIRAFVKRAKIGGVLAISDLVQITDFIYGVYQMKLYLDKLENQKISCDLIGDYINQLVNLNSLRKEIELCIDIHGHIVDNATPRLKEIRTQIKVMESRTKEKINRILSTKKEYLTDSIITIRNDRYVLPVKVEYKNSFQGIIHDMSQSGNTVYIEPKAIVEMNNKVNALIHEEKEEIQKILRRLTELVAENDGALLENSAIVKSLDFIFAKAKFARDMNAVKPIINSEGIIKIFKGRHPLIDQDEVVPNDIFLGEEYQTIIITGPNTGGKTVTLKTVGLFTLMMQAGLLVPANYQTELAVFDNVFADIGDEQSIEQSLSTFSSHMKNIIHITSDITINSLVLLDELGAGTDPKEGAALAVSILDYLNERGSRIIATTHYSELKTYAYNSDNIINASVEFDVETLRPTYKLLIGIPGRSNALDISRRLGLNNDIITKATEQLETEKTDVNKLIIQLENQGLYLDKLINENEMIKTDLLNEKKQVEQQNNEFNQYKAQLKSKAQQEAQLIVKKAQQDVETIIDELKELKKTKKANYKEHEVIDIKSKLNTNQYYKEDKKVSTTYKSLQPGNLVKVLTLNRTGELLEKVNETEWLVQIGILSSRIHEKNLELIEGKGNNNKKAKNSQNKVSVVKQSKCLLELDLRGLRYEDALIKLDKFIDSAMLGNYHQVSIIHGHGTGALRKGVQSYLKKCPYVKSFRFGGDGEGGLGVTVVSFN